MKKLIFRVYALILCAVCIFLTACNAVVNEVSVSISKSELVLSVGGKYTLTAIVSGEATKIEWTTSNEEVVKVIDGEVEGVGLGRATVTASVGTVKATCEVRVVSGIAEPDEEIKEEYMVLKVGSYNVCHLSNFANEKNGDVPVDPENTARIIKNNGYDIIGLNEIYEDNGADKPFLIKQTKLLSRLTGLESYVFGHAATIGWAIEIGNGIISKYPFTSTKMISVPQPIEKRPEEQNYYEDRGIVIATIDVGVEIDYVVTHFGLNGLEQENMVEQLIKVIDERERPMILCGDFNMAPDNARLTPIYERLTSAADVFGKTNEFTASSQEPSVAIDYIFLSEEFEVLSYDVIKVIASDHFPIVAEVKIEI